MERSSRRTRDDDTRPASSVEPGVQCHAPWSGQAPEGGRLRDDRERSLMSPDTTVATKVEAQLEERLPVFEGYEEQLNGRPLYVDRNRSANGSGNDGSGESVPVSPAPVRRGPRLRYTSEVVDQLECFFQHTPFPSREDRELLNQSTNLNQEKIKVWFQNRRARERRNLRLMGAPQNHLVFRNVAPSTKVDEARARRSTPASSTVTSSVGAPQYLDNEEEKSETKNETVVDTSISSSCSSSLKSQIPVLHHLPLATTLQPSHSQVIDPLAFKSLASHGCFSTLGDYYRAYTDQQSNPRHSFAVAPRMCLSTNSPGYSWDGRALRWNQRPSWHIPYRPYSTSAYGSGFSTGSTSSVPYRPLSLPSEPAYSYGSCGVQVLPYQNYLHQQQFSSGNSKTGLLEMGNQAGWKDEIIASQEMGNRAGWKVEAMASQEMGNRAGWKDEIMANQEMENRAGWKDEAMASQEMGNRAGWKNETMTSQDIENRAGWKVEMMASQAMENRAGWKDEAMASQEMGNRAGWKDQALASQEMENRAGWTDEALASQEMGNRAGWKNETMTSQDIGNRAGWKVEMMASEEENSIKEEAENGKCSLCDKPDKEKANLKNTSAGLEWCSPGEEPKLLASKSNWAKPIPQPRKCEEISNDLTAGELLMNTSESGRVQNISDVEQLGNRFKHEQILKVFETKHMQHVSEMELMRNISEMNKVQSTSGTDQVQSMSRMEHVSGVEQMQNTQKVEQTSSTEQICNVQKLEQIKNIVKIKRLSNTSVVEPTQNPLHTEKTSIELEEVQNACLTKQMPTNSQLALVYKMKQIGNTSNLSNMSETNPKWNGHMAEPCGQHSMSGVAQFHSSPMEQTQCSSQELPNDWDIAHTEHHEAEDPRNGSTTKHLENFSNAEYVRNIMEVKQNWNLTEMGHAGTMTEVEEFDGEFSKTENVQSTSGVVGQMSQTDWNPKLFGDRSIPWTRPSVSQCYTWNRVADEDLVKTNRPNVYPLVKYQQYDESSQVSRTECFTNLQEDQERRSMLNPFWSNAGSRGSVVEGCRRPDLSLDQSATDDDVSHSFPACFRGELHFREMSTGGTYLDPNMQVRSSFDCIAGQGDWSASGQMECISPTPQGPGYLSSKPGLDEGKKVVGDCPDLPVV